MTRIFTASVVGTLSGLAISALSAPAVLAPLVSGESLPPGFAASLASAPRSLLMRCAAAVPIVWLYGIPMYRALERRGVAGPVTAAGVGAVPGLVLTAVLGHSLFSHAIVNPVVITGISIALVYHLLSPSGTGR